MKITHHVKKQVNIWAILSFAIIGLILLPNLIVGVEFFTKGNDNWQHIKEYLLFDIVSNTVILLVFTGVFTTVIGSSLAWLITAYTFPLRNFLKWALFLPLAIPPFIGAYTYQGIFNYTGIVQSTLRNVFDIQVNPKYINLATMEGTIFIFTMFLFPYIYVITKGFLENQSASIIETAQLLGVSSFKIFFKIILPLSRAAIIGGVMIVLLEVINDYGVVKYFGIQTFITAIFQTWFGMGDLDSAFKLAGTLMIVVMTVLILEKLLRGRKRFSYSTTRVRPIQPRRLTGLKAWIAFGYAFLIFSLAFFIPFLQLVMWVFMTHDKILTAEFITLVKNSLFVATISAAIIVSVALIVANYTRLYRGLITKILSKVTVVGYTIPGAIIAIGVVTVFIALDDWVYSIFTQLNIDLTFYFRTSFIMLVAAYVIRFLSVGYNSVEAGFEKVGNQFTEASRTLGSSTFRTFYKVDLPLVKASLLGGFILAFVDILKELPLTMLLQPFNFSTLATKAFVYANDEMVNEAASASVLIILISGICIFFFHKVLEGEPK
ncbi:iron ABC transporter permease [Bacillus carboniphilus]|uniref:Iron ABC transporter permease n=1 Tax=Bacillus carboniphilus TaxID=86663 RepID=A0ABN0WF05_9BACI